MALPQESTLHPALAQAPIFAGLPDTAVGAIADRFRPHCFQRDDFLLFEGDPTHIYFLIAEGQVKMIQASADGLEVILHLLGPGELIGALPNLESDTYPASAVAMGEVLAYGIAPSDFEALLHRHPRMAVNLLRFAAARLRAAHDRLRELATERVERRIALRMSCVGCPFGPFDTSRQALEVHQVSEADFFMELLPRLGRPEGIEQPPPDPSPGEEHDETEAT